MGVILPPQVRDQYADHREGLVYATSPKYTDRKIIFTQNMRHHRHRHGRGSCTPSPPAEATLVVVLAQPGPQLEHHVSLSHDNKPNTMGFVAK